MQKGCDHSTGGVRIGAALKASGFKGVFRYAATDRDDVNISADEYADLKANGIDVGIVNEFSAAYLLGGYNTGRVCALGAREVTRRAGMPDGVVYMGGDSETLQASQRNLALVADAMRGAGDGIGRENAGYYGSYFVIQYLVEHEPWIKWYWQTLAWSGGNLHPKRNAYQYASTVTVGGVELDLDDLVTDNWGQRGITAPPTEEFDMDTMLPLHNEDGRVDMWVINLAGRPAQRYKTPDNEWSDWRSFGIPSPAVELSGTKHKNGILEVFAKGKDGHHYRNWQDGANGNWQPSFTPF